ncbi:MAG: hypothetical protein LBL82_08595 [Oscillospiraceae bacterium]|jgi:hypothetical protein|nr:hypothetical protein [Oscillospiraceae bacterium]
MKSRKTLIIVAMLLVCAMFTSMGYAYLSSSQTVTGTVTAEGSFDVDFGTVTATGGDANITMTAGVVTAVEGFEALPVNFKGVTANNQVKIVKFNLVNNGTVDATMPTVDAVKSFYSANGVTAYVTDRSGATLAAGAEGSITIKFVFTGYDTYEGGETSYNLSLNFAQNTSTVELTPTYGFIPASEA